MNEQLLEHVLKCLELLDYDIRDSKAKWRDQELWWQVQKIRECCRDLGNPFTPLELNYLDDVGNWAPQAALGYADAIRAFDNARPHALKLLIELREYCFRNQTTEVTGDKWSDTRSPSEWADYFDTSPSTLKRWIKERQIRVDKQTTKRWRINQEDVERLRPHKQNPTK